MHDKDENGTTIIRRVRLSVIVSLMTVIVSVGASFGTYSVLQYRVQDLEKRSEIEYERSREIERGLGTIRESIVDLKAEIRFLREELRRRP